MQNLPWESATQRRRAYRLLYQLCRGSTRHHRGYTRASLLQALPAGDGASCAGHG